MRLRGFCNSVQRAVRYRRSLKGLFGGSGVRAVLALMRDPDASGGVHPLFDSRYYRLQIPRLPPGTHPLLHYLAVGAAEGLDPHPWFQTRYYLEQNPDVAATGINPLLHFWTLGANEDRSPHPLFPVKAYRQQYPELEAAGLNPVADFANGGMAEGRRPVLCSRESLYRAWHRFAVESHAFPVEGAERSGACPDSTDRLIDELRNLSPSRRGGREEASPVSILIPASREPRLLLRCLRSIFLQPSEAPCEIIVAGEFLPESVDRIPDVRSVHVPAGSSLLETLKLGAQAANGEILVFLDSAAWVLEGWLDALARTFHARADAGLVGAKVLSRSGQLLHAGGVSAAANSRHERAAGDDPQRPEHNWLKPANHCSGTLFAIRRSLWEESGAFHGSQETLSGGLRELEFRTRNAGYQILYQPLSAVVACSDARVKPEPNDTLRSRSEAADTQATRDGSRLKLFAPSQPERIVRGRHGLRILCIDACTPTPDQDAGSWIALDFMGQLVDLGCHVSFIASECLHPGRYTEDLQQRGVECLYPPYVTGIREHLQTCGENYDAVVLFRAPIALRYMESVKQFAPRAKCIFHTVDLHYLREERQARVQNDWQGLCSNRLDKARELSMVLAADCTVVVSEHERDLLTEEIPRAGVHVFPFVQEAVECRQPLEMRRDILFIGGFNHLPNVDGVLYFARDVLPLINESIPDLRLLVIGSNIPAEIEALESENVAVVGYVPDLTEHFERCRLSIAPLRFGAGIKGKVVISLAHGVPCVATSIAAEGIGLAHGRETLIADSSREFADAVIQLYTDPELWLTMSRRCRDFVSRKFSSQAARLNAQHILEKAGCRTDGPPLAEPWGVRGRELHNVSACG